MARKKDVTLVDARVVSKSQLGLVKSIERVDFLRAVFFDLHFRPGAQALRPSKRQLQADTAALNRSE